MWGDPCLPHSSLINVEDGDAMLQLFIFLLLEISNFQKLLPPLNLVKVSLKNAARPSMRASVFFSEYWSYRSSAIAGIFFLTLFFINFFDERRQQPFRNYHLRISSKSHWSILYIQLWLVSTLSGWHLSALAFPAPRQVEMSQDTTEEREVVSLMQWAR